MDTSIRFYNTNSNLRLSKDDEHAGRSLHPISTDENGYEVLARKEEAASSSPPATAQPEQMVEKVDVADFEAIFQRFQVPITNFIYHLIGNREQACDLAQDVFVKAYKALLGGTVVQPGALSAWLYRIAANTTTDSNGRFFFNQIRPGTYQLQFSSTSFPAAPPRNITVPSPTGEYNLKFT